MKNTYENDYRRTLLLIISIMLLVICGVVNWKFDNDGPARMLSAATGRVGLVMGALWLAWPSLKRPARWLPPGIAVAGVVMLGVLAARPQLVIVAPALFGILLGLSVVVRWAKG